MKNLNILKKITLLVNSFKCDLVKFFYPNQEFINVINAFFVYCFIIVLSSCSGSEFLKRKYTSGKFTEHKKSLKHNTVYADTNTNYTSLSVRAEFKKATTVLESFSEEKIIEAKIRSIVKKDSIFIIKRKGKDSLFGKQCDTKPVIVILNSQYKVQKYIHGKQANKYSLKRMENRPFIAICFALIPIVGFVIVVTNHYRIIKYQQIFRDADLKKIKTTNRIMILIFTILSLVSIAFLFYVFLLIWLSIFSFLA